MSYYGAGDYYGAGGIFGDILGGIAGAATGFLSGGPLGAVTGAIGGFKGKSKGTTPTVIDVSQMPAPVLSYASAPTIQKTPGVTGVVQRLVPGGQSGYQVVVGKKRRRMNVGNAKALRRAIRREQGFVKLAKRALKGTGYQVTTRGSTRRRPVNIRESGAGSVIVR